MKPFFSSDAHLGSLFCWKVEFLVVVSIPADTWRFWENSGNTKNWMWSGKLPRDLQQLWRSCGNIWKYWLWSTCYNNLRPSSHRVFSAKPTLCIVRRTPYPLWRVIVAMLSDCFSSAVTGPLVEMKQRRRRGISPSTWELWVYTESHVEDKYAQIGFTDV